MKPCALPLAPFAPPQSRLCVLNPDSSHFLLEGKNMPFDSFHACNVRALDYLAAFHLQLLLTVSSQGLFTRLPFVLSSWLVH